MTTQSPTTPQTNTLSHTRAARALIAMAHMFLLLVVVLVVVCVRVMARPSSFPIRRLDHRPNLLEVGRQKLRHPRPHVRARVAHVPVRVAEDREDSLDGQVLGPRLGDRGRQTLVQRLSLRLRRGWPCHELVDGDSAVAVQIQAAPHLQHVARREAEVRREGRHVGPVGGDGQGAVVVPVVEYGEYRRRDVLLVQEQRGGGCGRRGAEEEKEDGEKEGEKGEEGGGTVEVGHALGLQRAAQEDALLELLENRI